MAGVAPWFATRVGQAQVPARQFRIGVLSPIAYETWSRRPIFVEAMRERGWIEGTHFVVDGVVDKGDPERMKQLALELVGRRPDVIFVPGTPGVGPMMAATRSIPIVFYAVGDPVGSGFVDNLARPGGNVTGLGGLGTGLGAKMLELLTQAVPRARRVGLLRDPDFPGFKVIFPELERAANGLGVALRPILLRTADDLDAAFAELAREKVDALHLFGNPFMPSNAARIAALVAEQRLAAISPFVQLTQAGLLMSYNSSLDDTVRRLAYYLDRILKGTPAGDLPVEQPTRFYLTLNLKAARAIGVTLPQSLLLRADEVLQ